MPIHGTSHTPPKLNPALLAMLEEAKSKAVKLTAKEKREQKALDTKMDAYEFEVVALCGLEFVQKKVGLVKSLPDQHHSAVVFDFDVEPIRQFCVLRDARKKLLATYLIDTLQKLVRLTEQPDVVQEWLYDN